MSQWTIGLVIYLSTLAIVDAWQCECGYYCPDPIKKYMDPKLCPVGSYCLQGLYNKTSLPYSCTPGRQCPYPGLCAAIGCPCGTYCPAGSSQPIKCTKNTYCPTNSSKPILCHAGECPFDGMCAKKGSTTPASCPEPRCDPLAPPPPGFVCLDDPALGCGLICIDPAFCPSTTEGPNTKPPDTSNQIKRTSTTTQPTYTCGFYIPHQERRSDGIQEQPCKPGYYCPLGPTPSTPIVPLKCPGGYVCGPGTCTPVPCPCGYKCPEGSATKIKCQPPFYCPNALATSQTVCPIGFKCDKPGLCNATACQPGTFVSCAGKQSCDQCPKGRYCPTATSSVLCPKGFFCPQGSSAPKQCPAAAYCPLGSEHPSPCPEGKSSSPGSHSESQCTSRRTLDETLLSEPARPAAVA